MKPTPEQRELAQAITASDAECVRRVCASGFPFGDYKRIGETTWLGYAVVFDLHLTL